MDKEELEETLSFYTRTSILMEGMVRELSALGDVSLEEVGNLEREIDSNIQLLYYLRKEFNKRRDQWVYVDSIDFLITVFNHSKRHIVTLGNTINPNRITLPIM